MKPILMQPDGSLPTGITEAMILEHGLTPVFPSIRPNPKEGFRVVETAPVEVLGKWFQSWEYVPAETPVAPPMPALRKTQFTYLLALSGLEDLWDTLEATLKTANVELYAALKGHRYNDYFRFDETVKLINQFKPFLPEGVTLSEETLTPLWLKASEF